MSACARRFCCRDAACTRRTFAERLPALVAPYARRTRRLAEAQGGVGVALGGEASADTVLRLVRRMPTPERQDPPRVVGVDDRALREGRTYGTILVDLERRRVLDLLPDRTAVVLAAWLRCRPGIEVVARDRSTEYARGIAPGAPGATRVADRWHLLANVRQALERWLAGVRARLRRLPPGPGAPADARPGSRTGPFPRTRAEAVARGGRRARRVALHEEVGRRHAAGERLPAVGRAVGLAAGTVREYAYAEGFPLPETRPLRPSVLDPHLARLEARLAEGREDGLAPRRELRAVGFPGTARQVHRWLAERRTAPARTTPHEWRDRPPAGRTPAGPGRPPALPSPARLAWLLVRPPAEPPAADAAVVRRVEQDRETATAAMLARRLTALVRGCGAGGKVGPDAALAGLETWLADARTSGVRAVETFAAGPGQDGAAVRSALTTPWSNGQAEGQLTRLKLLKRQMYGRAGFDLLRRRALLAA